VVKIFCYGQLRAGLVALVPGGTRTRTGAGTRTGSVWSAGIGVGLSLSLSIGVLPVVSTSGSAMAGVTLLWAEYGQMLVKGLNY